jgi:hypothetical protein
MRKFYHFMDEEQRVEAEIDGIIIREQIHIIQFQFLCGSRNVTVWMM